MIIQVSGGASRLCHRMADCAEGARKKKRQIAKVHLRLCGKHFKIHQDTVVFLLATKQNAESTARVLTSCSPLKSVFAVWLVVAGTTLFTLGFKTAKKGQPLFWFSLKPRLCMLTSHICHHLLAAAGFDSINQPVCTILGPANLFAWVPWLTVAGWACGWNGEICQRRINKPELPTKIVMNHHWNWYTPSHKPGVPVLCRKTDDQPRL